ncbi:MAG: OmpA family protein [Planctomycetes bacterium]|nr:OmpA family protein [Planctomycetota bacterium]
MRAAWSLIPCFSVILTAGCVPADQHREVQFRLQQVTGERDALRQALDDERARTAALEVRVAEKTRACDTAQAETSTLKAHGQRLAQSNAELLKIIEQRSQRSLERPEVPASPLPPRVDQALQALAAKYAGRIWYDRGRGAISLANDRLFDPASDTVRQEAHALLGELAGIAALTPGDEFEVLVVGHSDSSPITKPETLARFPSNWHLSTCRAIAVKSILVAAGLPEKRMGVMGYGPYRPLGQDQAHNRRVEVFLAPKGAARPLAPVKPDPG